ncbi:hypothetical protein Rhe02_54200 [Rhizocola hellebori]|uniref:Uncharacterized protein n=1 Tax=Rhizocola hellebori TaxID=1392758 RepID=A0A8J3QAQ7_9ACTN|nr:hypothetical protein [Rhizocola hellebori]GIH07353.1 hypothetical protein Rhe02_54200 [Rhizocola hellebori]
MTRNLSVTIFELLGTFAAGALFMYLAQWARELMRANSRDAGKVEAPAEPAADPPMLVVAPWSDAGTSDVLTGVVWRREIEAATVPVFESTPLPDHVSVWRMPEWKLDDPDRTQLWPIIKGYDAEDLDPGPEPEVDPNTRRRFVRSDVEMGALAVAQGFESAGEQAKDPAIAEAAKWLPKARSNRKVLVDLDANKVVVS